MTIIHITAPSVHIDAEKRIIAIYATTNCAFRNIEKISSIDCELINHFILIL